MGALTPLTGDSALAAVLANGTSTTALVPGTIAGAWGFRSQFRAMWPWFLALIGPSLVGSALGTLLVILYPRAFDSLVPWLILTAAVLFLAQPLVRKLRRGRDADPPRTWGRVLGIGLFQFAVALYGGYFGAGIGILMLSGLGLLGISNILEMNALKNVLAAAINATSCVLWIANGQVAWEYAAPMALASILGGLLSAHFAQKVPPTLVRWLVIAIGFALAGYYFFRG